jgi:hypothetical protein
VQVACDWITAGDVDAVLVIAAEQVGGTSAAALTALGLPAVEAIEQGALAVLVSASAVGPVLHESLIEQLRAGARAHENAGFHGLEALCRAAGLPDSEGFGSVRAPE